MLRITNWLRILVLTLSLLVPSAVFADNFSWQTSEWKHISPLNSTWTPSSFKTTGVLNDSLTFKVSKTGNNTGITVTSSKKGAPALNLPYPSGLALMPYDFYIRTIKDMSTGKTFWVVKANEGNKVINYGSWIIGEYKGKYVVFVSESSLASVGWYRIAKKPIRTAFGLMNGNLYMRMTDVHIDPNLPGYKTWTNINPVFIRLFWDEKSQWFGLERVNTSLDLNYK